jgi:hypothetical protein
VNTIHCKNKFLSRIRLSKHGFFVVSKGRIRLGKCFFICDQKVSNSLGKYVFFGVKKSRIRLGTCDFLIMKLNLIF